MTKARLLFCGLRGFRSFGFACVALGILATEALDAAGGVHQFLLAGEEGMAGGADFHADRALVRRAGRECASARAMHVDFTVIRMNGCFHFNSWSLILDPDIRFYRSSERFSKAGRPQNSQKA